MKKSIIVILVIIGLIGLFIYYIAGITQSMDESVKIDAVKAINKCPEDYSKLFNGNKNLVFDETNISKTRNPIAKFTYNDKFRMFVYRVNSVTHMSLDTGINDSYIDENLTHNFIYGFFGEFDQFNFLFKSGTQDKASKVYLNIRGLQTQTIKKNDTLAYYYSRFRNFSIKYKSNGAIDFFGSVKDSVSYATIPIEIMFIERKNNLYLVILTSINNKIDLASGTLMGLIKK
jgi:hypothetical protein